MDKLVPYGVNVIIPWYKQKTTYVALSGVLTAAGAYCGGEISLMVLLASIFAAVGTVTVRLGVEKSTYVPKPSERGDSDITG